MAGLLALHQGPQKPQLSLLPRLHTPETVTHTTGGCPSVSHEYRRCASVGLSLKTSEVPSDGDRGGGCRGWDARVTVSTEPGKVSRGSWPWPAVTS